MGMGLDDARGGRHIKRHVLRGGHEQALAMVYDDIAVTEEIVAETYCEVFVVSKKQFDYVAASNADFDPFVDGVLEAARTIRYPARYTSKNFKRFRHAWSLRDTASRREMVAFTASRLKIANANIQAWRHEGSRFRRWFNNATVVAFFAYLLLLPVHLTAFFDGNARPTPPALVVLVVVSYASDCVFILDVYFHIAGWFTFTKNGAVVSDAAIIRARYLHSWWATLDVTAAIPLGLLAPAFGYGTGSIALLRLNKTLRASHASEYFTIVERNLLSCTGNMGHRIIRLFVLILIALHWVACIWLLLGQAGGHGVAGNITAANVWIADDHVAPQLDLSHSEAGFFGAYLRSLYFAVVAMSTIGYGDIVPSNSPSVNLLESWAATVIVLFGGLLYPAVVGGLASLLMLLGSARQAHRQKLSDLREFMRRESLPQALQDRVIRFHNYQWSVQGGVNEREMLRKLPKHIRLDMSSTISTPIVTCIPFFSNTDPYFIAELVGALDPEVFLPSDNIITAGMFGNSLYIIERGQVNITTARRPDDGGSAHAATGRMKSVRSGGQGRGRGRGRRAGVKTVPFTISSLTGGDCFGEAGLLNDVCRSHTCVSLGYCDVFILTRAAFKEAMRQCLNLDEQSAVVKQIEACHDMKMERSARVVANMSERQKLMAMVGFTAGNTASADEKEINGTHWQHPESNFRLAWDILVLFVVLFNVFVIPFRLGFSSAAHPTAFVIDYILDAFLIIDIVMNLQWFAYVVDGQVYARPRDIRWAYVNAHAQEAGGFWPHFFTSLPYDALAPALVLMASPTVPPGLALAICRLPKLIRAAWVIRLVARFEQFVEKNKFIGIGIGTVKMAKLFVGIFIVSHWSACFFYAITRYNSGAYEQALRGETCTGLNKTLSTADSTLNATCAFTLGSRPDECVTPFAACAWNGTWIGHQITDDLLPSDAGDEAWHYIRALNWALPTLVVVVIGDVTPVTMTETVYCIIIFLLGLVVNATIIGNIASVVANTSTTYGASRNRRQNLEKLMQHFDTPPDLRTRVRQYLTYAWESQKGLDARAVVKGLPPSLNRDVMFSLSHRLFRDCTIFADTPFSVIKELASFIELKCYVPGDHVVVVGAAANHVYFVQRGSLDVIHHDVIVARIKAKGYFGESALDSDTPRSATIVSSDFTYLLELHRSAFFDVMRSFPEEYERIQKKMEDVARSKARSRVDKFAIRKKQSMFDSSKSGVRRDTTVLNIFSRISKRFSSRKLAGEKNKDSTPSTRTTDEPNRRNSRFSSFPDCKEMMGPPVVDDDAVSAPEEKQEEQAGQGSREGWEDQGGQGIQGGQGGQGGREGREEQERQERQAHDGQSDNVRDAETTGDGTTEDAPFDKSTSAFSAKPNNEGPSTEPRKDQPKTREAPTIKVLQAGKELMKIRENQKNNPRLIRTYIRELRAKWAHTARRRRVWERMCLAATVYWVVAAPVRVATSGLPGFNGTRATGLSTPFWFWDVLVEVWFLVDVVMRLALFPESKQGRLMLRSRQFTIKYLKGYFVFDLVAAMPFTIYEVCVWAKTGSVPPSPFCLVHLFRLLRLGRLLQGTEMMGKYVGGKLRIHAQTTLVFRVFFLYATMQHVYACLWIVIHRFVEPDQLRTWATKDGLCDPYNHSVCSVPFSTLYSRSLYFVVTITSTVGYGDIRPYTVFETVFCIITVWTGAYV